MPALSSSSASLAITYLPAEILFSIFGQLEDPRHLYSASLACKAWRAAAIDVRLWEDFYWRYYRGGRSQNRKEDQSLTQRATQRRHAAMRQWFRQTTSSSAPLPAFLNGSIVRASALPNFTVLFAQRMAKDDNLLQQLRRHIARSTCTLGSMLQIIHRYGDASRELLAALVAVQQITTETVAAVAFTDSKDGPALRAIDVHTRAAGGQSHPQQHACLALRYAAQTILSHLQRREAIRSLATQRQRWESKLNHAASLRERIMVKSLGAGDVLSNLALFRYGERNEVGAYLDLLALYAWTQLVNEQRKASAEQGGQSGHDTAYFDHARCLMSSINLALHSINFGLVGGDDAHDLNNGFYNAALCCPTQRKCVALTLMTITCCVARRLGIAAAPLSRLNHAFAVVFEGIATPSSWPGDSEEREWGRFFVAPRQNGPSRVIEVGTLKSILSPSPQEPFSPRQLNSIVEPTAPDVILRHVVLGMQFRLQHGPPVLQSDLAGGPSQAAPGNQAQIIGSTPSQNPLELLHDFLAGQSTAPPWPLDSPLLPSSLALLPSTRAGAPREKSRALREDAQGVCSWISRLTTAVEMDMTEQSDRQIMATCIGELAIYGPHRADIALLLELGGGDIGPWLRISGQVGTEEAEDVDQGSEDGSGWDTESKSEDEAFAGAGQRSPSSELLSHVGLVLGLDKLPCNGIGGSGGAGQAQRDPPTVRVLDQAFPASLRARYHIGTVFKHRVHGYYGVVAGRSSQCRLPEAWMVGQRTVSKGKPLCCNAMPMR